MMPVGGRSDHSRWRWSSDLPNLTPRRVRARVKGWYLRQRAERLLKRNPAKAEAFFKQAATSIERALGPEFPELVIPLVRIGEAQFARGDFAGAEQSLRRAVTICRKAYGRDASTAWAESKLAALLTEQGRFDEADALLRPALEIYERFHGREHPEVAYMLDLVGKNARKARHFEEAEVWLTRSTAIWQKAKQHDAWVWATEELAAAILARADALFNDGAIFEAESLYARGRELLEAALGPHDDSVGLVLDALVLVKQQQGLYRDAEALCRREMAIYDGLGTSRDRRERASLQLAEILQAQARFEEARELLNQVSSAREGSERAPSNPDAVAEVLDRLARLELRLGNYQIADQVAARGLALLPTVDPRAYHLLDVQADAADGLGLCQHAYDLRIATLNRFCDGSAERKSEALFALGCFATRHRGLLDEAHRALRQALEIDETGCGGAHPWITAKLRALAAAYVETDPATAAALYERALAILDRNFGTNYPDAAGALTHLAGLRTDAGRLDEAKQLLDRAQHVTEQEFGINHPDLAVVLNCLGYWHAHSGRIALAVQAWQHSLEITKASLGPNHPDVVDCLDFWEEGLREANQPEEADRIKASADRIRIRHVALQPHAGVLTTQEA